MPNKKRKLAEVVPGKAPLANKPKYVEKPRPGRGYGNAAQAPDEDAGSRPMHKVKVGIYLRCIALLPSFMHALALTPMHQVKVVTFL